MGEIAQQPVSFVEDLSVSRRAAVVRLRLSSGQTAIAKRPSEPSVLANELEALRLLPPGTRPKLIASGNGVILMEDLGTGLSLADLLLGRDRAAADGALRAWATALGSVLAATLRTGTPPTRLALSDGQEELVGLAGDLGVPVPQGVDDDVALIEETFSSESPWLAFCPGDTCPDNNHILPDGSVRFFDFEGAGWRHAATEAAYCRAPFSTCWCLATLPPEVVGGMEEAFLDALDPPRPVEFAAVIGLAAVSWTVLTFRYFRKFVLQGGPVGPVAHTPIHGRPYVLLRLALVESECEQIPALAELARRMTEAILARWPEAAEPPAYPAFVPPAD